MKYSKNIQVTSEYVTQKEIKQCQKAVMFRKEICSERATSSVKEDEEIRLNGK